MRKKNLTPRKTPLKTALKEDKLQIITNKAFDQFREKTFAERQKPLYSISNLALTLMHLLSIAFAGLFVFGFILKMISGVPIEELDFNTTSQMLLFSAGILLTGAILAIVEAGKVALGNVFSDNFLRTRKIMFGPLFFLVVLMACSIGSSVNGSVELAEIRSAVDPKALRNEAEIAGGFDKLIAQEKKEIADAKADPKNQIFSNGKTELSWVTRKDNALKEKRVSRLLDMKARETENARVDNTEIKSAATVDTKYYSSIALLFSSIVEALILMLIFYRRQYLFYTFKETEIGLIPYPSKTIKPGKVNGQNNPGPQPKKMPRQTQAPEPTQAIKFSELVQKLDTSIPEQANDLTYFQKYEPIVEGYLNGGSISQLAKMNNKSEGTIKTIRKRVKQYV